MAYLPQPPRKPIGVAILAILVILAGVILTLLSLLLVVAAVALAPVLGGLGLIIAGIALILSLLLLAAGIGLWNLRPWAWWLTMIVLVLGIINQFGGVSLSGGLGSLTTGQLVSLGLPILILIYLLAVRGSFRSQAAYMPPR